MIDLKGKKLLVLGGDARSKDIVECAKQLGVYSIVADWYDLKRSPAKLIADEYWNQDIFQTEEVADLIRSNHVDGVITGFSDSYLLQYNKICTAANLPCYATADVFKVTLDKALFKQACIDNGVPVVPAYDLATFDPAVISDSFKVIVKPVDNSGSRGIKVCQSPEDFSSCLEYALSFSQKKQVVIERFMEMDSFSVSYTIQDGVISLSTINDRIVHKTADGGAVTVGGIYPSKYIHSYLTVMDEKVKQMYRNIGVKNGVLFIQGFTDGKDFYFYEMGYRLSGGRHYIYTKHQNDTSSLEYLITFALTGKMADYPIIEKDNALFPQLCCQVNVLGKEGVITAIEGYEYVQAMPGVIYSSLIKNVGDTIGADGTTAQQCVSIYMVVDDYEAFESKLNDIEQHLHLYDKDGNDLVMTFKK